MNPGRDWTGIPTTGWLVVVVVVLRTVVVVVGGGVGCRFSDFSCQVDFVIQTCAPIDAMKGGISGVRVFT